MNPALRFLGPPAQRRTGGHVRANHGPPRNVLMWVCGNHRNRSMSRLTIDITSQQHQSLKALAALQGKTIKQYALERLFVGDADGDKAWHELQALLRARIDDGLAGKATTKSFGEIVREELGDGART